MRGLQLAVSAFSILYGGIVCSRSKQPLFFKILLYGQVSYFFGVLFTACYALVYQGSPVGFHVGYFGHAGAYFFLFSSYYGAINRLVDGGEKHKRKYRCLGAVVPLALAGFLIYTAVRIGIKETLPMLLLFIPISFTLYFAVKHLILPNAELGILKEMRPYNVCVFLFCIAEVLALSPSLPNEVRQAASALSCLLLLALLPLAEKGVRKWFI